MMREKVKSPEVTHVAGEAFIDGVAIGYHYPDTFVQYWERSFALIPESEWQEMKAHGLELSDSQQESPLDVAVEDLAAAAIMWARTESPGLLNDDELSVLGELAGSMEVDSDGGTGPEPQYCGTCEVRLGTGASFCSSCGASVKAGQ